MNIIFQYGQGVLCLPSAIRSHFATASGSYFKVLLYLSSLPSPIKEIEKKYTTIAKAVGVPKDDVAGALIYWMQAGMLVSLDGQTEAAQEQNTEPQTAAPSAAQTEEKPAPELPKKRELPDYTAAQQSNIIGQKNLRPLIDECAGILGKVFSPHEINTIVALNDYLGLNAEYIMTLFAYCQKKGKTSMRYIERMAVGLLDEDVDTVEALEQKIQLFDQQDDMTYQIRKLFGIGARALTAKEKTQVKTWLGVWGMTMEMIEHAYELTVSHAGKASIPYAGKIMERWYKEGQKTLEQVTAAEKDFQSKKESQTGEKMSDYNLDEFLELAMKRSDHYQ